MIRAGDLNERTKRMIKRVAEVDTEVVRGRQGVDPLGFGLTYPVIFMSYDIDRGIETPLSGLMHEDDPNLVVVSLVAEAIAEEHNEQSRAAREVPGTEHVLDEVVYVMEVWA